MLFLIVKSIVWHQCVMKHWALKVHLVLVSSSLALQVDQLASQNFVYLHDPVTPPQVGGRVVWKQMCFGVKTPVISPPAGITTVLTMSTIITGVSSSMPQVIISCVCPRGLQAQSDFLHVLTLIWALWVSPSLKGTRWPQCLVPRQPVGHVWAEVTFLFQRSDSHRGPEALEQPGWFQIAYFYWRDPQDFYSWCQRCFFVVYWTEFARL